MVIYYGLRVSYASNLFGFVLRVVAVKNLSVVIMLSLFLAACGGSGKSKDKTSPLLSVPSSITVAAVDGSGTAKSAPVIDAFLKGAYANDDRDGPVGVSNDAPAVFPLATTTVTFTATDAAGNSATATASVTVSDQSAPVLVVPEDASFVAVSGAGISAANDDVAAYLAQATASDNVDASVTVTNDAPDTFPIGETTVVFTAADVAGNQVSASVTITVAGASQMGAVVKGPLVNAIVFFDYDGDKELDANEPRATTDEIGGYELVETSDAPDEYSVVVLMGEDTIDVLSGESYADSGVELSAAKGGEVITPLTTLYEAALAGLADGEELTEEAFAKAMGLPEGVDIANYNPYAKDENGDYINVATATLVEAVAQNVMTALEVISESIVAMSKTALQSETGISPQQAAQAALKAVAKAAAAASKAPAGSAAADFDLSDASDLADVNSAVLEGLSSSEEGSLGAQLQATAASSGKTADIAAATVTGSVILNVSAKTIATVSNAFNAVSSSSFGTSAASAVSRLKAQAVAETAQAGAIVVQAVAVQQASGQTVVLSESDVDVSGVVTLDNAESVQLAIAANEQEVVGYLLTTFAPVIESANSFEVEENQTGVGRVIAVDTAGDILTYSLSGADGTALTISSTGVLSFVTPPDFETKALYQVTVKVVDSNGNFVSQNVTIVITDANDDAPTITSSSSYTVDENQTAIGSVVASSASGGTLAYSVSGSDLVISSGGVLSFVSAPDYEKKSSYSATVSVSDGDNTTSAVITVGINNLNDEAPVITSSGVFTVKENQKSVGTVTAIDADFNALSYSLSGADAASFTISSYGIVRFKVAPNYEEKSRYTFNVNVTDGKAITSAAVIVKVTDVEENGVIGSFGLADGTATLQDYYPQDMETVSNTFETTLSGSVLSVDMRAAPLNLVNIQNALAGLDFSSPLVSIGLASLPVGSGTETVTIGLVDGADSVRSAGERQVNVELVVDWSSDGEQASVSVPAQTVSVFYINSLGARTDLEIANVDDDLLSITEQGPDYPASLNIKLLSALTKLEGMSVESLLGEGVYTVSVTTSLPLSAATGETVRTVRAVVEIADAFRLSQSAVTLTDYHPLSGTTVTNELSASVSNGLLTVDLRSAPLNMMNLQNATTGDDYITPVLSFGLSNLPVGSGTETVEVTVVDGEDADRDEGERQINAQLTIEWVSDGVEAVITVPAQTIEAFYVTSSGVRTDIEFANGDSDLLSVTAAGADVPKTLDVKLLSLITQFSYLPLENLIRDDNAGVFNVKLITSLPLASANGLALNGITSVVEIADAFQLSGTTATIVDYDPATAETVSTELETTLVDGVLGVDLSAAPLNFENLQNAINGDDFNTPVLSFSLSSLPSGSGTDTVSIVLIDGADAIQDNGERKVSVSLDIEWESDGTYASITVPTQILKVSYETREGVVIDVEVSNVDADMLSVTRKGANYPATLDVKLLAAITKSSSLPLSSLLETGVYNVQLITDLPLVAADGSAVTGLSAVVYIGAGD